MGRVKSVAYFSKEAKKCFEGEAERDMKGCCSDETEVLQLEDEHSSTSFHKISDITPIPFIPVYQLIPFSISNKAVKDSAGIVYDLPPPDKTPIYILHSSFTFYG